MGKFTQGELDDINKTISTPVECLTWAFDNLHPKLAKASSFGAEDASILMLDYLHLKQEDYLKQLLM